MVSRGKGSSPFLKKRTKKLFPLAVRICVPARKKSFLLLFSKRKSLSYSCLPFPLRRPRPSRLVERRLAIPREDRRRCRPERRQCRRTDRPHADPGPLAGEQFQVRQRQAGRQRHPLRRGRRPHAAALPYREVGRAGRSGGARLGGRAGSCARCHHQHHDVLGQRQGKRRLGPPRDLRSRPAPGVAFRRRERSAEGFYRLRQQRAVARQTRRGRHHRLRIEAGRNGAHQDHAESYPQHHCGRTLYMADVGEADTTRADRDALRSA